jgi:uncharacterized protein
MTWSPARVCAALAWASTARPWATVAVAMALFVLALLSALTLRPGTAVRDMLGEHDASARAFSQLIEHFQLIDDLTVLVELPDGAPDDPAPLLAFAQRFAAQLAEREEVGGVSWTTRGGAAGFVDAHVLPNLPWYLSDPGREALQERLTPAGMTDALDRQAALLTAPGAGGAALREQLVTDPLRLRELLLIGEPANPGADADATRATPAAGTPRLSPDGRALLVRVAGTRPANDLPFAHRFVALAHEAIDAAQPGGLGVGVTGAYAIADYSARSTRRDMIVSMLGSLVMLSVLFVVLYRSWHALPITLLTVNTAIVAAFGVYAATGGALTPVTAVAGAVLAGLGIDYCVHVLAHADAVRVAGRRRDARKALALAVGRVGPSMLAACVTSVLGFAALTVSDVRSLREFALLGGVGLVLSLFAAITLFPALVVLMWRRSDRRTGPKQTLTHGDRLHAHRWMPLLARHPRAAIACSLVALAAGALVVVFNGRTAVLFADDLEALHPRPNPPLIVQERVAELYDLSPGVLLLHVEADDPDALLARAHAAKRALRDLAQTEPRVGTVHGATDLLPDPTADPRSADVFDVAAVLAAYDAAVADSAFDTEALQPFRDTLSAMLARRPPPSWPALRDASELAAPLLPRGVLTAEPVAPRETLLVLRPGEPWEQMTDRRAFVTAVRDALAGVPGVTLTGLSVIGLDTQQAIAGTLLESLAVAALAVGLVLFAYFRRPVDVLLAMLPAMCGLVALLAVLTATHHELNAFNLVALPLTLGLGVDDGIFLTHAARRLRVATRARAAHVLAASGRAIVVTSLTTLIAFGALAFTNSPAVQSLGVLSAVGVMACLLASLLLLVPVLLLRGREPATR